MTSRTSRLMGTASLPSRWSHSRSDSKRLRPPGEDVCESEHFPMYCNIVIVYTLRRAAAGHHTAHVAASEPRHSRVSSSRVHRAVPSPHARRVALRAPSRPSLAPAHDGEASARRGWRRRHGECAHGRCSRVGAQPGRARARLTVHRWRRSARHTHERRARTSG